MQALGKNASETTTRYTTGPERRRVSLRGISKECRGPNQLGQRNGTEKTGDTYTPVTLYGLITAGQYPAPGSYTDTLSTATASFNVNVTVVSGCAITATNLAFGTYTKVLVDSTSTISVTCTNTTTYNVGLNQGTASSATVTTRKMTGPGGYLSNTCSASTPTAPPTGEMASAR